MKVTYMNLAGKDYPMCLSLKAVKELSDRFNGIENLLATEGKTQGEAIEDVTIILNILLEAGASYVNRTEGAKLVAPSADELAELYGLDDILGIKRTIVTTLAGGTYVNIEGFMCDERGAE